MARAALPNEACALLAGQKDRPLDAVASDDIVLVAVHPVANSMQSPTLFVMDGQAMITAEDEIDLAGQTLIGVLHSHPTSSAVPSPRDLADARNYDPNAELLQIIVSMQGFSPALRAFRYDRHGGAPHEFDVIVSR